MKILVTGAAGLLGAYLVRRLVGTQDVAGVDRNPWWGAGAPRFVQGDLEDRAFLDHVIRQARPEVVIHCAAMVDVDGCQRNPERAMQVNAGVTRELANRTVPDCLFVYISTDSVFDGVSSFCRETEVPSPANVYARSKLAGEREAAARPHHLIIRTNFYGWSSGRKKTSAEWLYGALRNGEAITLYEDYFFTPIYAADLADRLVALLEHGARGLFHVAGRERVSKYQFGEVMARLMGVSMVGVNKGSIHHSALAAPRPSDLSLDSSREAAFVGMESPSCEAGVARFLGEVARFDS